MGYISHGISLPLHHRNLKRIGDIIMNEIEILNKKIALLKEKREEIIAKKEEERRVKRDKWEKSQIGKYYVLLMNYGIKITKIKSIHTASENDRYFICDYIEIYIGSGDNIIIRYYYSNRDSIVGKETTKKIWDKTDEIAKAFLCNKIKIEDIITFINDLINKTS